ncbi:hypothetical protein HYC85_016916 [Camellia sinensis]|uniref:GATA-type domain-containing protein n=1 Tax=Camellia sinensis TaxID=4442 RepID=A0A7J7H4N8_CAMSI|nr:hypothetical protein HYC85_016916 [Camellia sinensis]
MLPHYPFLSLFIISQTSSSNFAGGALSLSLSMTPTYVNSSSSPFPVSYSEDQKQHQLHSSAKTQASSVGSSSSSLLTYVFTNSIQDQGGCYHKEEVHQLKYQQQFLKIKKNIFGVSLKANNFASQDGLHDHAMPKSVSDHGLKSSLWKKQDIEHEVHSDQNGSAKSKSSKTRVMLKMKFEDQKQPSSPLETYNSNNSFSSNISNPIRVCADCNTTKTPLWRSGPRGPKSLCNACGIRQRKARRAMAAAAANGATLAAETSTMKITKVQHKHQKRSKLATKSHGRKKLCFEDFLISLSKNLAFHRIFPQDEKEAAILLMALSCGLVHG